MRTTFFTQRSAPVDPVLVPDPLELPRVGSFPVPEELEDVPGAEEVEEVEEVEEDDVESPLCALVEPVAPSLGEVLAEAPPPFDEPLLQLAAQSTAAARLHPIIPDFMIR